MITTRFPSPSPSQCAYPSTPSPQHRTRRPAPARCRRPPSRPSRSPLPAEDPGAVTAGGCGDIMRFTTQSLKKCGCGIFERIGANNNNNNNDNDIYKEMINDIARMATITKKYGCSPQPLFIRDRKP